MHDAWWEATVKAHGERDGTRALIEVLLLSRHLPHEHLVTGLAAALKTGALTADAVALEARKAADADTGPEEPPQPPSTTSQTAIAPCPRPSGPTCRPHSSRHTVEAIRCNQPSRMACRRVTTPRTRS